MFRIRNLATFLFVIAVPSVFIYYSYYDTVSDRRLPRFVSVDRHKYAAVFQQNTNNNSSGDGGGQRRPLVVGRLPSEAESRDPDPEIEKRRQFVKQMMKDAWENYVLYAWGHNELKPLTREPKKDTIFGAAMNGLTIVDSMDTLLLMGMEEEFVRGREWIASHLHFGRTKNEVSVFETVIRYVGGLLSCYALTGDELFLNKSHEIAQALLPAYSTETGIPNGLIIPKTGKNYHHRWAYGAILSEFGSQHLEYVYLSDMTGDSRFRDIVIRIRNLLNRIDKPQGMYMQMIDNNSGRWTENKSSLGALSDSFYEYLIKAYVQSGHRDTLAMRMYLNALNAIDHSELIQSSPTGLTYLVDLFFGKPNNKMQHLTCFAGGMYALGAHHVAEDITVVNSDPLMANRSESSTTYQHQLVNRYFELGENITNTCHESYIRAPTGLGPETFYFDDINEATNKNGDYFILRPETIESYFVLWRLTNESRYRDYAWQAAQSIYRYCRTESGYSGIHNVMKRTTTKDNTQQSFFLAETLKYLYLIFSNDHLLPLDEWVFNTEAHPLPICGKNPAYPTQLCNTVFE